MYKQTPAIGRRRNFLDEETVEATDIEIGKGEVQCPLDLPAELLRFSLYLPLS